MGVLIDRWDRQKLLVVTALLLCHRRHLGTLGGQRLGDAGRAVGAGAGGRRHDEPGHDLGRRSVARPGAGAVPGDAGGGDFGGRDRVHAAGRASCQYHWRGAFAVYALILPIAALAFLALGPHARRIAADRARPVSRRAGSFPGRPMPSSRRWPSCSRLPYVTPTRLPFHLEALGTTSPLVVGALMAALVTVSAPVSLMYGRIRQRLSAMTIFGLSFVLIGAGFLRMPRRATGTGSSGSLIAGLAWGFPCPIIPPGSWSGCRRRCGPSPPSGLLTTAFFIGVFRFALSFGAFGGNVWAGGHIPWWWGLRWLRLALAFGP